MRLYRKRRKNFTNSLSDDQKIILYEGISYAKRQTDDKKRVNYYLTGTHEKSIIEKILTYYSSGDGFKKVCDGSKNRVCIQYTATGTAKWYTENMNKNLLGDYKQTSDATIKEDELLDNLIIEKLNGNESTENTGNESKENMLIPLLIIGVVFVAAYFLILKK